MEKSEFVRIIQLNKVNSEIIKLLPQLNLPDAWLVSGSLFQTVWNHLTGRDIEYGIKDYDIFYFDDSDLSWEAEDKVIKQVQKLFSHLDESIEVRNQARVHLWYPEKFSTTYPPLTKTTDGIDRFLARACQVGLKISNDEPLEVYSPSGYNDLEKMIIRPNLSDNFSINAYQKKANRWKSKWSELIIIEEIS